MPDQPKKLNQIFICYRREDTAGVVGRIYDRLVQRFGKDTIFKDVDSLPLGRDFRRHIESVVSECCVALVVVGDRWIGASGASRLDDPRDYVRIEIESALKRDIPVIPLLVQNAELPPDERLPDSLKDFAYRNGMTIGHDPHFHSDVDRLIKHLEELIEDRRKETEAGLAATSTAIPAHEQAARVDRQGSAGCYQQPIQVSPGQELPPVASMTGGSPEKADAASQPVKTQTDFWIAPKDRRRIVLLYLCAWLVVGLIGTGAHTVLTNPFGTMAYELYRCVLIFVSLLVGLTLAAGQTIILKSYIGSPKRWIGYTFLASGIEGLLRALFFPFQSVLVFATLHYLIRSGLQWLLLRKLVKRAWLWICAGFAVGMVISAYAESVSLNGFEYVVPFASYDRLVRAWTGPEHVVVALLSSSLIAVSEIACLIRFRRK
jgi:hypothetical protein